MEQAFRYDPLPERSIRLLEIEAISENGEVTARLLETAMSHAPPYRALSYVWGPDVKDRTIRCNGRPLAVTTSLYDAICGIREAVPDDTSPIWMDAVCINQDDNAEKARGVRLMDLVYQRAECVVVWLGPAENNSDLAMRAIPTFAENLLEINPALPLETHIEKLEEYGLPNPDHAVWQALGSLFCRPWFGRLWTFQEAVLANDMVVVCGACAVSWEHFDVVGTRLGRSSLYLLALAGQDTDEQEDGFHSSSWLTWTKNRRLEDGERLAREQGADCSTAEGKELARRLGTTPFITLMRMSQTKRCSDPRDRVYGVISLTTHDFRARIDVSYTKAPRDLFIETGKACLLDDPSLRYLLTHGGRPKSAHFPSWCVDLAEDAGEISPFEAHLRAGRTDDDDAPASAELAFLPHGDEIALNAYSVDTVDTVIQPTWSRKQGLVWDRVGRRNAWLRRCAQLARQVVRRDADHGDATPAQYAYDAVPVEHVYAVTANTLRRVRDGDALRTEYIRLAEPLLAPPSPLEPARIALNHDTAIQLTSALPGRAYFSTGGGRLGIGPPGMRNGDVVVVVPGCRPVFVLRPSSQAGKHVFVGDAFVHGLMEWSRTPSELLETKERFIIV